MPKDLAKLTEDEWFKQFNPIPNHLDEYASFEGEDEQGTMFETYGDELEFVLAQNPNTVWTYADGDNGGTYIWNGYRLVNRIGYFITAVPFDDTKDYQIEIWGGDEE
jgi:hypothetical protein